MTTNTTTAVARWRQIAATALTAGALAAGALALTAPAAYAAPADTRPTISTSLAGTSTETAEKKQQPTVTRYLAIRNGHGDFGPHGL